MRRIEEFKYDAQPSRSIISLPKSSSKRSNISILDRVKITKYFAECRRRYANLLHVVFFLQCRQFAIVFITEIDDGSFSRSSLWRLGKTRDMLICRRSQQRSDHCNVDSVVNGIICMN